MLEQQAWMHYAPEMLTEWQQMLDEGKAVKPYHEACRRMTEKAGKENCEAEAVKLLEEMRSAPELAEYPYDEPSDYEGIEKALSGCNTAEPAPSPDILRDRITGTWIGRIAGCLLGEPLEGLRRDKIQPILTMTGNSPMNRYVDSGEFTGELREKVDFASLEPWQKCWADTIGDAAPADDDTNYTVFALKLIQHYGRTFRPEDVLEGWLTWIPMFSTCTAERVAYRNAAQGMLPPETATHLNPYREWIGAQIRGDFYGYINPGDPHTAAQMAWRDASVSHVKNGIYGEMFAAAMIARAAVCHDRPEIIRTGLREIPSASRLKEAVEQVISWHQEGKTWEEFESLLHARYDEWNQHHWCHTISNAMIVAAALLWGEGDFGKSICRAVEIGFDTDCNGATVGSIAGMINGETGIPPVWPDTFHRTLRSGIDGYQRMTVEQLADMTMALIG